MLRPRGLDFRIWWVQPTALIAGCETLAMRHLAGVMRSSEDYEAMNRMVVQLDRLMVEMYDGIAVVTMRRPGRVVLVSRTWIAVADWKDCSVAWCVRAARIVGSSRSH